MINYKYLFSFYVAILTVSIPLRAAELPRVELQTTMGVMEIELFNDKAPRTVKNFLSYVNAGFYDGLIFHRVINDWIIQGGGYDSELNALETKRPIKNEATNGLKNVRGTVAMARSWDPRSADSQFFINLSDNSSFDHTARTIRNYGYCVFARVVNGMAVADNIGKVETHKVEAIGDNVPVEAVIVERVKILD